MFGFCFFIFLKGLAQFSSLQPKVDLFSQAVLEFNEEEVMFFMKKISF